VRWQVGQQALEVGWAALAQGRDGVGQVEDRACVAGIPLRERGDGRPVIHAFRCDPPPQDTRTDPPQQRPNADVDPDEAEAVVVAAEHEVGHPIDVGAVDVDDLPVEHVMRERDQARPGLDRTPLERVGQHELAGEDLDDRLPAHVCAAASRTNDRSDERGIRLLPDPNDQIIDQTNQPTAGVYASAHDARDGEQPRTGADPRVAPPSEGMQADAAR